MRIVMMAILLTGVMGSLVMGEAPVPEEDLLADKGKWSVGNESCILVTMAGQVREQFMNHLN